MRKGWELGARGAKAWILSRSLAGVLIADWQLRREGRWSWREGGGGPRGEAAAGSGVGDGSEREGERERWGVERQGVRCMGLERRIKVSAMGARRSGVQRSGKRAQRGRSR